MNNLSNSPPGFGSDNFVASINDVEARSPEMVSVTELGNGMVRSSTHLLEREKKHTRRRRAVCVFVFACCCGVFVCFWVQKTCVWGSTNRFLGSKTCSKTGFWFFLGLAYRPRTRKELSGLLGVHNKLVKLISYF